ncbi:zinc carboxypeptidase [Aureisphaera sp. CAU 1614]|uniref:Zinc carboxypeptidase n=1 Tax=Halomarinibacterium sedimenti TaxID=2857106 RepID=A0A9X1FPB4_9FLAO|nr:M14 family metallopeptidase [Halomarinibacterium sedimenti]MBW2937604.1 zinc carboxypeptidase [Halomarinibacterium sedimenti]
MKKFILAFVLLFSILVNSQDKRIDLSYYLPTDVTYNPNIPTPKSIVGHEVGEWHITHDKLVYYMYALAEASDRITIENRGTTFEGRPILLLTITSPSNHKNIETLKAQHLALTENGSNALAIESMPIVVYQGFSIHGNEPSGSNAALAEAYYLAAAQGPKIEELLKNTIILFDPSFNPDGLQRFSTWANQHKAQNINPDPNDREYSEVWPGGRTNHYWFDLNRDWLPAQLPESRARIKTFHDWYPNILTDHHEMGTNSTFFFQPGIPSRTHPLTPKKNQELTAAIGKFHAKAFNKLGSFYYTEEDYDDFYYGKGSTFPDINGAVGILFEQGSSRGHAQESENGILTFPYTIRNQFTAALSTLEAAVSMRTEMLNYQRDFYANARSEASKDNRVFVFGDEKDAAKTYHLAEILQRHKIKFRELYSDYTSNGKTFKKGYAFAIPKNQKQSRLINAMFEKRTTFQDSLFYDISAWSFPLAFNLDFEESSTVQMGLEVTDLKLPTPTVPNPNAYAYLMEWHEYYAPKALSAILENDIRAKVAMQPFTVEGKKYDYGTILIPVQNQKLNDAELFSFIKKVSGDASISIASVATGLTQGIDLGSGEFRAITPQKVAVLVGDGINPYDAGEIWHLFDTRYQMKITKLEVNDLSRTDLSKYTDIILPATWGSGPDKNTTEKLKDWTKNGGNLIAFRNSGKWLNSNELLKMELKTEKDTAQNISFEQRGDYYGAQVIGGAIFEAELDRSHPIAFGYKNATLPLFRNTTMFVTADKDSYNNPIQYTSNPLLSGYISSKNLSLLKNTVPFKTSRLGKGRVMYFTDNTNFRAFWYGTNKLLMNAIFFGGEM